MKDKIFTFRELQEMPSANPADVVRTFDDYVATGASIHARSVIEILDRANPGIQHLGSIGENISAGIADQTKRGFPCDADEYRKLGDYISKRMNKMMQDQQGS